MKKLFFIAIFTLPLVASAQRRYEDVNLPNVTLVNTASDVQNFLFLFKLPFYYSIQVTNTRNSGTAGGAAIIEQSNDPAPLYANKQWALVDSIKFTNVASQTFVKDGLVRARYLRVRYVTPSGLTGNNTMSTNATFKLDGSN